LLLHGQITESYTFTTNRLVPDGNAAGLSDARNLNSAISTIASVTVRLKVTGEFNGDLYGYVRHASGFTVLLNRPGKTAANPFGYADSGFDVSFQTGPEDVDVHIYQSVTTPAPGLPLTGTWQPDGRDVDPTNVTGTSVQSTSLTNFNGLNADGQWTLYLADLNSGGSNLLTEWSLNIAGAAYPTLTWSNPTDIVYGAALGGPQLNATATYNSTNVPGTFSYNPPLGTVLNAGQGQTLAVTFTPSDTNSFMPITAQVTLNVDPAPLTITANDTNKVYGAALPTFTASYSGFVDGDVAASLTSPVTLSTTATASSPLGSYPIVPSGAADANYTIREVNGTLTIYTINQPPVLAAITNVMIPPGTELRVLVEASDPHGYQLTFSLDPGAPAGAVITNLVRRLPFPSTNTLVIWDITRAEASTTNLFTVRVTNDGQPPMSTTQSFVVMVQDYLELSVGSTNVQTGQSAGVPVYLSSSDGVTNLEFVLQWPDGYLTNGALTVIAPAIASGSMQDQITNLLITLQTAPGQTLQGTQQVAQLSFSALSNSPSAFVQLPLQSVTATKPDASPYTNYLMHAGTVAVVRDRPLLLPSVSSNQEWVLTVFGRLGAAYQVQGSTNPAKPGTWQPVLNYTQTNGAMSFDLESGYPKSFYRVLQP